jgi:hypothetical protein
MGSFSKPTTRPGCGCSSSAISAPTRLATGFKRSRTTTPYSANDGATFNGAWNNYPFFKSGNIVVSDINNGLFVHPAHVAGWHLGDFDGGDGNGNGGGP